MQVSRREILEAALLGIPASIVGRAMSKSNLVPALEKVKTNIAPATFGEWNLYETCGQSIFPVYTESGGLATRSMCWLIRKRGSLNSEAGRGGAWESIPVEFNELEFLAMNHDKEGAERLMARKIAEAIEKTRPVEVNPDGGDLPMPEDVK
jgi:hypothetical protein